MAGIQSHYEINVSFKGKHLFATDARSAVDDHKAQALFNIIKERFPVAEGFEVTVTHWRCGGERLAPDADGVLIPASQVRKTLAELEAESPDGFRNPPDKQ